MIKISNNKLILNFLGILAFFLLNINFLLPLSVQGYTISDGTYAGNAGYFLNGGGVSYDNSSTYNNSNYPYYNNTNNTTYCNPIPVIYAISPNSVNGVSGNLAVVLTGANFTVNSLAEFNNSYRPTTFMNSNRLTVILNASDLTTNGIYPVMVFNPQPCGGNSNGIYFRVDNTIINPPVIAPNPTPPTTTTKTVSTTTKTTPKVAVIKKTTTPTSTQVACAPTTGDANNQSLTASAIFGANGFMPSNIIQWLVFSILILLAVILWRKVYVSEKDKSKPLKHP